MWNIFLILIFLVLGAIAVELGAKLMVMESSDEGGDDLSFRDV